MNSEPLLTLSPSSPDLTALLAQLPDIYGVYAFRSGDTLLHLSWSAHLRRRLARLLHPGRPAGNQLASLLTARSANVCCWPTGSSLETSLLMYRLATEFFPADYAKRLRLRPPWFVTLTADAFPRILVTNRLHAHSRTARSRPTIGPFLSREAAVRYEEAALGLFQIRRCTETLDPNPDHPGCIYGEMSLCLRPCQLRVSRQEYASEAARAAQFLTAGPEAALDSVATARDRAAEQLDFEGAAQLHRQLERLQLARNVRPEAVLDIEHFHGIAIVPGALPDMFLMRPIISGSWQPAVPFHLPLDTPQTVSLDSRLRDVLDNVTQYPVQAANRSEDLALFSRWYHGSSRVGDWFPFQLRDGLPYRKLARGVSRMARALASP